jgi:hypothetical protein
MNPVSVAALTSAPALTGRTGEPAGRLQSASRSTENGFQLTEAPPDWPLPPAWREPGRLAKLAQRLDDASFGTKARREACAHDGGCIVSINEPANSFD